MAEKPEQIKKYIAVLREFEEKYGEYLGALEADLAVERAAREYRPQQTPTGSGWSDEEFAKRKREIAGLAARADRAMKASGVNQYVLLKPPMMGGGVQAADLPSQIFHFVEMGYGDDGLSFQRSILERIPSQLAGLEMKLEEAETAEEEDTMRLLGERIERSAERARERANRPKVARPTARAPERKHPWHELPLVVQIIAAVVGTVIGGLILAAILGLVG